ncbi:MAG: queuosine precursor transporter [Anaerolineales bacterium]|nr:queuosine precursor transporter [Anaerolineales bacterium]
MKKKNSWMIRYRWYHLVISVFVTTLIVSNIIAVKVIAIFGLILPAAVILFPVAYIIGDVLTEVYGYGRARQAIWIAFGCNLLAVAAIWIAGILPPASSWTVGALNGPEEATQAFRAILGFTPRLLLASFIAYLAGEFVNAFILAKMKILTQGQYLWTRTIGSTLIGQGIDSLLFISIAFYGVLPSSVLVSAILAQWLVKSIYEALATPLTYLVVNALKRAEGIDTFDTNTDFSPLRSG